MTRPRPRRRPGPPTRAFGLRSAAGEELDLRPSGHEFEGCLPISGDWWDWPVHLDESRFLMATTRSAATTWHGSLFEGAGRVELESSGLGGFDVTWASRAEDPAGRTSPEELIGAAHSACFSMALSNGLAKAGSPPETLETRAEVTFQPGQGITGIHLARARHGSRDVVRGVRRSSGGGEDGLPGESGPRRHDDHARGIAGLTRRVGDR